MYSFRGHPSLLRAKISCIIEPPILPPMNFLPIEIQNTSFVNNTQHYKRHTCPRVKINGGGVTFGHERGDREERGVPSKITGAPLILSFIAFLCDNFQNFPKFPNFEIPQGGGSEEVIRPPPFRHICQKVTDVLMDGTLDPLLKILEVNRTSRWTIIS